MKKPSPLIQMTVALVALCSMLVLMADLFFNLLPGRDLQTVQIRKHVSETLAVQVATLLQSGDRATLKQTFDGVVARDNGVRSLAIRRTDGTILVQAGAHDHHWRLDSAEVSDIDQLIVPLKSQGARWGSFEVAFDPDERNAVLQWFSQPLVLIMLFVYLIGTPVYWLYMRRALQHLDPSSVIPERVQGAFDAMSEGVVILDARGRLLLASKSFRSLDPGNASLSPGISLSALPWLDEALPADLSQHPWIRAMAEAKASSGSTLIVNTGSVARQLVVNCAPISDPGGNVRGCLVTFNDISDLHRANAALRASMSALSESKQQIQRQNQELQRLATRDPLTGCLNRRALHEALDVLVPKARAEGESLCCVMVDIDHFKSVNDTHGHAIGDRVIQEVTKKLTECVRSIDLVCRYGGEEFCLILPGLTNEVALSFAERVRSRIEKYAGSGVREVDGLSITVSLGVNCLVGEAIQVVPLIDGADHALYRAKRAGRNRAFSHLNETAAKTLIDSAPAPAIQEHEQ